MWWGVVSGVKVSGGGRELGKGGVKDRGKRERGWRGGVWGSDRGEGVWGDREGEEEVVRGAVGREGRGRREGGWN